MNAQNDFKIMVLLPVKSNNTAAGPSMRAFLPKQQNQFYDEFKRSVHMYKEKVCGLSGSKASCSTNANRY